LREAEFNTWNPSLHIGVVEGPFPVEMMLERTLELTYYDRARQFDHIEWKLDNRDGLLTRPEYIAAGMLVRMRLGYIDGAFPWKAFIINRVQGGMGVFGVQDAVVGESESVVTYHGRNRNAPGGRGAKPWRRTARPAPKKPRKVYSSTSDVTQHEMLLGEMHGPRLIEASSTAEVVRKIAERNGFSANYALVEDTDDHIEGYTIPNNYSDGEALLELANEWGYVFKLDGDVLRWHSPTWKGAQNKIVDTLVYGDGVDITGIEVDADLRLPLPGTLTAKAYDFERKVLHTQRARYDEAVQQANVGTMILDEIVKHPAKYRSLTKDETFTVLGSSLPEVKKKLVQRFIKRRMRAFQLVAKSVGNPKLLAAKLIRLRGMYNPFVDGIWYISEAKHVLTNSTYVTEVKLKPPPAKMVSNTVVAHTQRARYDKAVQQLNKGIMFIKLQQTIPAGLR
jgi:phage protein D